MEDALFLRILEKELIKSLGCTEPVTITYAVALARNELEEGIITKVEINVSRNLLKNAMSVGIPGTNTNEINLSSTLLAGALGLIKPNTEKNLEILNDLNKNDIEKAKELISEGIININLHESESKLYLEVIVKSFSNTSRVVIENTHTNVILLEVNGKMKKIKSTSIDELENDKIEQDYDTSFLDIDSILRFVQDIEISKLKIIQNSIEINKKICEEGLKNTYGLKVGKNIELNRSTGFFSEDIISKAISYTAAGSDARMSGCMLPAMSNSGSGNQGISATIPVVIVAENLNISKDKLIRAVTLSNLITIYIKYNLGRLSAICGAAISAMGACCGITYLLDGEKKEIESALQIMMANVTGIICDGAKSGCALKVSTCTFAAIQSALLAIDGVSLSYKEGIIEQDIVKTLDNFCELANNGMVEVDRLILEIMLQKTYS